MKSLPVGLCWGTLIQAGLPDLITAAGAHGFPTITVPPAKYAAALDSGESPATLRRRLADAGVAVTMIDQVSRGLPGVPTDPQPGLPATSQPSFDLDACCMMADALGTRLVNITHYLGDPATPLPAIAEALVSMCDRAEARGLAMCFEFIPGTAVPDLGTANALRALVGPDRLRVVLDMWHHARGGGGLATIEALAPGAIVAVQLSDRRPPDPASAYVPMSGRDLPGEGALPLSDLVAAIRHNSPDVVIEIEVFADSLKAMTPDAAAARVAASVQAWIERAPGALVA